jgi:hypothetical protein
VPRAHSAKTLRLWLKVNRVPPDWTARSEQAMGLAVICAAVRPSWRRVWDAFACRTRFAVEDGAYGLLMDDLSQHLRGDEVAPRRWREDAVLAAMATCHARFWNSTRSNSLAPDNVASDVLSWPTTTHA